MRIVLSSFAALALAACFSSSQGAKELQARAEFDMQCPRAQTQWAKIDDGRTWGAIGCGRRATYVEQCEDERLGTSSVGEKCMWVLNGPVQQDFAAQPAPAPPPPAPAPAPAPAPPGTVGP